MNENEIKTSETNEENTSDIEKDILDEQTGETPTEEEPSKDDSSKKDKKKLFVILAIVLALLIGVGVYGYSANETKKEEAQKSAFDKVTVEVKEEYAETIPLATKENILNTKDMVEVLKDGKTDKNTTITKVDKETIDTSVEGGYTITYTVETLDSLGNTATKSYKKTFSVTNEDKEAPVITFKKTLVQISVGDTYDASDNIKSVKDAFEGDIKEVDKIPEEKGTSYYYVDDSKVDTKKAGEYKVDVLACDSVGNAIHEEFTVKVAEKGDDSTKSADSSKSADSTKETNTNSKSTDKKSTSSTKSSDSTKKDTSSTSANSTSSSSTNTNSNANTSTQKTQTCKEVDNGYNETYVTKDAWDETVVDQQAYDETVQTGSVAVCNGCGQEFGTYDEWVKHSSVLGGQGDWSHSAYHVNGIFSTVHHDATYKTVHHDAEYGTRWVSKIETVCN